MPKKTPKKELLPADEFQALRDEWMQTRDDTKLQAFCHSDKYRGLSYIERNRGFLTGSKIKIFNTDQWWYKLQYVDEVPPPYALDTEDEALLIGSCFDDLVTHGDDEVAKRYHVWLPKQQRITDVEDALREAAEELYAATHPETLKKDGTRYQNDITKEEKMKERIVMLNNLKGKKQVTDTQWQMVNQLKREWYAQPLFNQKPRKRYFFAMLNGEIPVKCELDDFIESYTNEDVNAHDFLCVLDMKTCANIEKAVEFARENYYDQMTLYSLIAHHAYNLKSDVDKKVCAVIEAADKHGLWSRSAGMYFSPELLRDNWSAMTQKIEALWLAQKTGIFYKPKEAFQPNCPFYGHEGYGRATKLFIV